MLHRSQTHCHAAARNETLQPPLRISNDVRRRRHGRRRNIRKPKLRRMSSHAARPRPKKLIYFGFERDDLAALILAFVIGLVLLVVHFETKDSRMDWPSVAGE